MSRKPEPYKGDPCQPYYAAYQALPTKAEREALLGQHRIEFFQAFEDYYRACDSSQRAKTKRTPTQEANLDRLREALESHYHRVIAGERVSLVTHDPNVYVPDFSVQKDRHAVKKILYTGGLGLIPAMFSRNVREWLDLQVPEPSKHGNQESRLRRFAYSGTGRFMVGVASLAALVGFANVWNPEQEIAPISPPQEAELDPITGQPVVPTTALPAPETAEDCDLVLDDTIAEEEVQASMFTLLEALEADPEATLSPEELQNGVKDSSFNVLRGTNRPGCSDDEIHQAVDVAVDRLVERGAFER